MSALLLLLLSAVDVTVELDGCAFEAAEVERLAELELAGSKGGPLVVLARCTDDALNLVVVEPSTRSRWRRKLNPKDLPQGEPARFVAVAVAETLQADAARRTVPQPPPVPRLHVGAVVGARYLPASPLTQLTFGLRGSYLFANRLGVRADVLADVGQQETSVGRIVADGVGASVMGLWRLTEDTAVVFAHVGLGLRGWAQRFRGSTDVVGLEGRNLLGFVLGPAASIEVLVPIGPIELTFGVEAGFLVRSYRGTFSGVSLVSVSGAWVTPTAGVSLRF
ncbi:MAG: hypothetical protein MUC96_16115 [Myxococcaceae bacterium]|jgi:hypothetical protein|nr:hypothetical protein [Myxococcaceae bacterium]